MKQIEEKKLAQLIRDSYELHLLENAGVDNWEGYDYAFDKDFTPDDEYAIDVVRGNINDDELLSGYKDI